MPGKFVEYEEAILPLRAETGADSARAARASKKTDAETGHVE